MDIEPDGLKSMESYEHDLATEITTHGQRKRSIENCGEVLETGLEVMCFTTNHIVLTKNTFD